jgi:hypothetical protein
VGRTIDLNGSKSFPNNTDHLVNNLVIIGPVVFESNQSEI